LSLVGFPPSCTFSFTLSFYCFIPFCLCLMGSTHCCQPHSTYHYTGLLWVSLHLFFPCVMQTILPAMYYFRLPWRWRAAIASKTLVTNYQPRQHCISEDCNLCQQCYENLAILRNTVLYS
jgi:hypothetical protein